jgi:hypothetical protein
MIQSRVNGALAQWWPEIYAEYWKRFPWRLPVGVEPHDDVDVAEPRNGDEAQEQLAIRLFTQPVSRRVFSPSIVSDTTRSASNLFFITRDLKSAVVALGRLTRPR